MTSARGTKIVLSSWVLLDESCTSQSSFERQRIDGCEGKPKEEKGAKRRRGFISERRTRTDARGRVRLARRGSRWDGMGLLMGLDGLGGDSWQEQKLHEKWCVLTSESLLAVAS